MFNVKLKNKNVSHWLNSNLAPRLQSIFRIQKWQQEIIEISILDKIVKKTSKKIFDENTLKIKFEKINISIL